MYIASVGMSVRTPSERYLSRAAPTEFWRINDAVHTTFVGIVFFGVTLLLLLPSFPNGQSAKCNNLDLKAVLPPTNKAYSMAMELAQMLQDKGFTIKCVLLSKMEGFFEELEGAALFGTTRDDFEALFVPKSKKFEKLSVLERTENGRHIYSFDGDPKPGPSSRIDSARRIYFVKHVHMLLEMDDDALAKDIHRAITGQSCLESTL
jgi:hypothetical protein